MKFKNKAGAEPADIKDVQLAHSQNGILSIDICGKTYGQGGFGTKQGVVDTEYAEAANQEAIQWAAKIAAGESGHGFSVFYYTVSMLALLGSVGFFAYEKYISKTLHVSGSSDSRKEPLLTTNDTAVMS